MTSKIHRATVTQADLDYVGSITVDVDLPRSEPAGEGLPATGLLAVAARVGTTRLIDNTLIDLRP